MVAESQVLSADDSRALVRAQSLLSEGELIAIPTDTVYGLAANVWDGAAVAKLYRIKERSELKSVPVLLSGVEAIANVAQPISARVAALAASFWPGPLTIVIERRSELPREVSADETVGVRVPDHTFARALLHAAGPLAVSSANYSGRPSARTANEVLEELGDKLALIIDGGRTAGGAPSTVLDCSGDAPELLRPGPITLDEVHAIWDRVSL